MSRGGCGRGRVREFGKALFPNPPYHALAELALAWLLSHGWISTVIVGATSPEHVNANVSAIDWKLSEEDIALVNHVVGNGPEEKIWGDTGGVD